MFLKLMVNFAIVGVVLASTGTFAQAEYRFSFAGATKLNINDPNNDWVESNGSFTNTSSGSGDWSQVYFAAYTDGLMANFTVNNAVCPTFCMVRLDRDVGIYNGHALRAELRVQKGGENQNISYRLREYDLVTGTQISEIAKGYIGGQSGTHWVAGEPITLAAALEGNELIFYSSNASQLTKIQMLNPITPLDRSLPWRIFIFSETESDSITATASGLMTIDVQQ